MKIIDDFFDEQTLEQLKQCIDNEITMENRELFYKEQHHAPTDSDHDGLENKNLLLVENEHFGLDNCRYYLLKNAAVDIILKNLYDKKHLTEEGFKSKDCMLRYHVNTAPYRATWHKDGLYEKDGGVDYVGITIFLNDWNSNNGGLFVYKEQDNDTQGIFVEPKKNRIIINSKDQVHAVTQISNSTVTRYSLQMFINHAHLIQ